MHGHLVIEPDMLQVLVEKQAVADANLTWSKKQKFTFLNLESDRVESYNKKKHVHTF